MICPEFIVAGSGDGQASGERNAVRHLYGDVHAQRAGGPPRLSTHLSPALYRTVAKETEHVPDLSSGGGSIELGAGAKDHRRGRAGLEPRGRGHLCI